MYVVVYASTRTTDLILYSQTHMTDYTVRRVHIALLFILFLYEYYFCYYKYNVHVYNQATMWQHYSTELR